MQRLPNPPWDISSIVDGTNAIKQLIYRQYRLGCVFGRSMHLTSAGSTVSAAKLITIFVVDLYSISYLVRRLNLIKRSRWSQGKTNCSFYFDAYIYIYIRRWLTFIADAIVCITLASLLKTWLEVLFVTVIK